MVVSEGEVSAGDRLGNPYGAIRTAPRASRPDKAAGQIRGSMLDALDRAGGSATLQEIADTLHRARPRDLRRRNLPMLEEAGIVSVNEEGMVGLAENRIEPSRPGVRSVRRWRLSEELVRSRYKEKSRAFRNGSLQQ